jgi:hypothetical protein
MNILEKILEEILQYRKDNNLLAGKQVVEIERIIRSHMDEMNNDGWIPVEERLPENERMVLVTCQTKKGIRSTNRAYYDGAFWHGSGSMSSVTAWQPLPEPYKDEEKLKKYVKEGKSNVWKER